MRVVAGSAGGLSLAAPGSDLRPTMDRVRGAIFSSLGERVPGARVLDLFAGSGALGIEALSRGAARAVFVDQDARAVSCIRRNLQATRLEAEVVRADVFRFVKQATSNRFDLIFADPPYRKAPQDRDFAAALLDAPDLLRWLDPGGLFVLERAQGGVALDSPGWERLKAKRYGSTEVLFLAATREGGES